VNRKIQAFAGAIAVLVMAGGYAPLSPAPHGSTAYAASSLSDLKGVEELKTLFNRDAGKVRLVLLLSPT
jgi:hypothetical protein